MSVYFGRATVYVLSLSPDDGNPEQANQGDLIHS